MKITLNLLMVLGKKEQVSLKLQTKDFVKLQPWMLDSLTVKKFYLDRVKK